MKTSPPKINTDLVYYTEIKEALLLIIDHIEKTHNEGVTDNFILIVDEYMNTLFGNNDTLFIPEKEGIGFVMDLGIELRNSGYGFYPKTFKFQNIKNNKVNYDESIVGYIIHW